MPLAPPRATYRLQLHAAFGFAEAEAVVPYLAALGISHLYLSPFLKARPGSLHGYDVVDHASLNPEIGDEAALTSLSRTLAAHGMGLVADFVPNHMGVGGADNGWWLDVLEWGEDSPYARYFDIDWTPPRRDLKGKVLLPFLGDHYGAVLERGELVPRFDAAEGSFSIWYWQHRFPLAIADYAALLRAAGVEELAEVAALLSSPARPLAQRRQRAVEAKARLAALAGRPAVAQAIARAMEALSGRPDDLHRLMERQFWRLSFWRAAADEGNCRRFFDINDLAALRMVEEPELFARAHRWTLDLVHRGIIQGLRVDHVDGLFNPAEYCRWLQARAGAALGHVSAGPEGQPLWLVVEKILAVHEHLRRDWPVAGTTGYDFANQVCGLFVAPEGEAPLTVVHARFIGGEMDFEREVIEAKKRIMDEHMASELRVLAARLGRIAVTHRSSSDFTISMLYGALREVVACLPVYRTYVTSRRVTDSDRRYIDWAVRKARRQPGGDEAVFDFVQGVLDTSLGRDERGSYSRRAVVDFAMRLQQYTGPVMAKGLEDTVFYRYNRLICLNEVGGDPTRFGTPPSAFHQAGRLRARRHPHGLLATATHDTKRGEDARVRVAVLSEMPWEWSQRLERWHQLNAIFRRALDSGPAPEPNDEIFLYQTMLGAWSEDEDFVERLAAATLKAAKEAKRRTSWAAPDPAYETAIADFVRRICERDRRNPFLDDFRAFHARVSALGMVNGLAQVLLKLTCPGVPDLYQGTELWDLSLVDPDNRRPVDFDLRRRLLGSLDGPLPADPALWADGAVKQELLRRGLDLRRRCAALFADGAYRPLAARGGRGGAVLAFARQNQERSVVVAVPLRLARLWPEGQTLPPLGVAWRGLHVEAPRRGAAGRWRDLLSGAEIHAVARRGAPVLRGMDLFARFPLALLEEIE